MIEVKKVNDNRYTFKSPEYYGDLYDDDTVVRLQIKDLMTREEVYYNTFPDKDIALNTVEDFCFDQYEKRTIN